MDEEGLGAGVTSPAAAAVGSRSVNERVADILSTKRLAVAAMALVNAAMAMLYYGELGLIRCVGLLVIFNIFYGVLYWRRWLRNRQAGFRCVLGFAAGFVEVVLSLLFFSTFVGRARMVVWLPVIVWLLLTVGQYLFYRLLVHHLELEDDETVEKQLQFQLV
jgi:hypothetical protein